MDEKTLDLWSKKISEVEKPVHLKELAEQMHLSSPTMSKVVHCLESVGRLKTKRCGQTWLIL